MRETTFVFKHGNDTHDALGGIITTLMRIYNKPLSWLSPRYSDLDKMIDLHFKQIRISNDEKDNYVGLDK